MLQPVVAAAAAWALLGEKLAPWQTARGAAVLGGIALARMSQESGDGKSPAI
jgi:drug/metabolite transporter (DMT)-like permease